MFQKREQNKTTEEGLSEVDIGSLPKKVQESDRKNNQRTRKKNRCTE